jgi:hypothetical protein
MPTFDAKCAAVTKVFGEPQVDRDDPSFVHFLNDRRDLATIPGRCGRDPAYVAEVQDLEFAIWQALDLICKRDGEKTLRRLQPICARPSRSPYTSEL